MESAALRALDRGLQAVRGGATRLVGEAQTRARRRRR